MFFGIKKVLGGLLMPLPLMLLIIGVGLILLWSKRAQVSGKVIVSIGWFGLFVMSLQPVADGFLRQLAKQ